MKATRHRVIVGVLFSLLAGSAQAAKRKAKEVDYLDLAAVLIRDGKFDRAASTLAQVDPATAEEGELDLPRFYTLRGLVHLQTSLFEMAASDFRKALEAGQKDAIVPIYLGQALFYSEDYRGALKALESSPRKAASIPSTFAMRADAHWKLEEYIEGWDVLTSGLKRYPDYGELLRRQVFFAIDRGLYSVAARLGRAYLGAKKEVSAQDYLAIGTALLRSGSVEEALVFLELARLRYPQDETVIAELARAYKNEGWYRTAAQLLRVPAFGGNQAFLVEAGELYRQAGEFYIALATNSRVADRAAKLRQRLAILLDLESFDLVAAMEADLSRVGLLEDENIRYAVAYSHFKFGDYERAERLLALIKDPQLFRKAAELRRAMQECRDDRWRC